MGRKTSLWTVQATNQQNLTQKIWTWLKKANLKRENDSLLKAAQNNAIRTNYVKLRRGKTQKIANVHYVVIEM